MLPNWKERNTIILFIDDRIVYVKTPQINTFLEIVREYSKVTGSKASIQTVTAFLNTSNEHFEWIPYITAPEIVQSG